MHGSYGEEITEAFAVEEGILLASEMELQQIIIKSDSLMVVGNQYKLISWRHGANYSRNSGYFESAKQLESEASEKGLQQSCA